MSQTSNTTVGISEEASSEDNNKDTTVLQDTISQKVTISELQYKFEYGIFEASSSDVNAVAKNFFSKSSTDTDILPPVTRWVSKDMSHIAVERPPFSVNISYDDIHFEEDPINGEERCESCDPDYGCDCGWESENLQCQSFEFTINIPWTVWFFNVEPNAYDGRKMIHHAHLFCSPTSIQSNDSVLYCLPLPNLYDSNQVCWGNALTPVTYFQNFSSYIIGSINNFWTSRSNNDLVCNVGTLELGNYSYTRQYLELYSNLSMEDVLVADFAPYEWGGNIVTFGDYCEKINFESERSAKLTKSSSNRASKFFKDLVEK
jgi:hypothetical protein